MLSIGFKLLFITYKLSGLFCIILICFVIYFILFLICLIYFIFIKMLSLIPTLTRNELKLF